MYKQVGETPLEALNRLRQARPELESVKLSYAGRLDPMAEGELLVLVGKENKEYERHLHYDKEYVATFVVGIRTDTGDALGLITERGEDQVTREKVEEAVSNLTKVSQQVYPWFSAQTVDGIKLFDHFKSGNTSIKRPELDVEIEEADLLTFESVEPETLRDYILESVSKVSGDFRQEKILERWRKFFRSTQVSHMKEFRVFLRVSAGTYIRALTEEFAFPTFLLKLKRERVIMD